MTDKDKQHHRRSIRLKDYDYSAPGAYFVTLCSHNRCCLFGSIGDGKVLLSDAGETVEAGLRGLCARFETLALDAFVIMPNHVHVILMLGGDNPPGAGGASEGDHEDRPYEVAGDRQADGAVGRPDGTAAGSVGRIVQAFKSITTNAYIRGVRQQRWPPFDGVLWQRNYYEHVIRDERNLAARRQYIEFNPARWEEDEYYPVP